MSAVFNTKLYDENGNLYYLDSNTKTSVYKNDNTDATTAKEALDELYGEVGGITRIVSLTMEEYNALSDDEKNNGQVYMITDAESTSYMGPKEVARVTNVAEYPSASFTRAMDSNGNFLKTGSFLIITHNWSEECTQSMYLLSYSYNSMNFFTLSPIVSGGPEVTFTAENDNIGTVFSSEPGSIVIYAM